MWKLTIEDDEAKQTSLPLAHDEYGIGRAEQNAIRLTDRNVSRKHATLVRNAQGWIVRDLESYNGTFVNGLRVAGEQHVQSGDVVQLGDYRLELVDEAKATESTVPGGVLPVHQRPDRLVVVVGPTPGAEFPLDREHFSIGRAEDADVSINHSSVSRFHAELISVGNGRYEIIDKNSANGIRINGQEVKRGFLEPGDALELGDVRLRFVGRGKIFRPGADQTQQLTAVASFESVAPSVRAPALQGGATKSQGFGKFIFIGALLGLVAIVVMLVAMRSTESRSGETGSDTPDQSSPGEDSAKEILDAAKKLADEGKLQEAHEKALELPEGSSLREHADFKAIEGKWADWIFKQVDEAEDLKQRYRMLHTIATTPTVDGERRSRAGQMLAALEQEEPDLKEEKPATWVPPRTTVQEEVYGDPNKKAPPPPSSKGEGGSGASTAPDVTDPNNYEAQKQALMPKVFSNKASKEEVKMLIALCKATGDASCRNRAMQILKSMP